MGEKKVTTMVLEVDLNCEKCRKKVKKILCKIPQIHDQVWDEKKNTVTIKVICCNPEKIKEKIICKGGDCIKSIKIVVPPPPPPPPPPPCLCLQIPCLCLRPPCRCPQLPCWPYPIGVCCPGGPCFNWHGGYMGKVVYDSYGGERGYCISHCDNYPHNCYIM